MVAWRLVRVWEVTVGDHHGQAHRTGTGEIEETVGERDGPVELFDAGVGAHLVDL